MVAIVPVVLFLRFDDETAPSMARAPSLQEIGFATFLGLVLLNTGANCLNRQLPFAHPIRGFLNLFGLDETWAMYTWGEPRRHANRFEGVLENGRAVDPFGPLLKTSIDDLLRDVDRWDKLLSNFANPEWETVRVYPSKYLCRHWNATAQSGDRLKDFKWAIYYEVDREGVLTPSDPQTIIWDHHCFL